MMYKFASAESKYLSKANHVALLGVEFSGGQDKAGVEEAPAAIIEDGLVEQLETSLDCHITYSGMRLSNKIALETDDQHRRMKNPRTVSMMTRTLSEQVYSRTREGNFVLTLGGDHSIAIGTIAGAAKAMKELWNKEIAVVWVDAHADINTPETSMSGNIHGMPLAFLTGLSTERNSDIFGWISEHHRINKKKLVYIGLRDVDEEEEKILRDSSLKAYFMEDIKHYGIDRIMDKVLEWLGSDTPIHLSFDIDALDPLWAPSTGTAVQDGLTLREGKVIASRLAASGNMIAMDLVEINPTIERQRAAETIRAGCSITLCALGLFTQLSE